MASSMICECTGPWWCRQRWVKNSETGQLHCNKVSVFWSSVDFCASAGSVCVLEPVCHGHYQIKNRNQRGSDLPKHGCALYLRERWTKERLPKERAPQCVGTSNHPKDLPLPARNSGGSCEGNTGAFLLFAFCTCHTLFPNSCSILNFVLLYMFV